MDLLASFKNQYLHMEWADALVWKNALSSQSSSNDEKIHTGLLHLHMTQQAFLAAWQGKYADITQQEIMEWVKQWSQLRGDALWAWGKTYHKEVQQYLSKVAASSLMEPTTLPWMDMVSAQLGQTLVVPTLAETLIQVPMHSMHHRGQINARLRELGNEPPLVDFIAWIWLGKPVAEWPTQNERCRFQAE
jgi:uncharacterized damage-inducible protein DinB